MLIIKSIKRKIRKFVRIMPLFPSGSMQYTNQKCLTPCFADKMTDFFITLVCIDFGLRQS